MATETERQLAVTITLLESAAEAMAAIPPIPGGIQRQHLATLRAMIQRNRWDLTELIAERYRADAERLAERLEDERILGELGILSVADELRGAGE